MNALRSRSLLLLRIALAFAFLFPPVDAFFHPDAWFDFFPLFVRGIVPDATLLLLWGAVEVVIALWILSGWRIFWPSCAAAILLVLIVFFNIPLIEVVFRDLALAMIAVVLALESYPGRQGSEV